jgi:hypothetical protein
MQFGVQNNRSRGRGCMPPRANRGPPARPVGHPWNCTHTTYSGTLQYAFDALPMTS